MAFSDPKKILVVHGGALGDLVLFVPTIKLLRKRFSDSELTLLGSPYSGSVLRGLPDLDELILAYHKYDSLPVYLRRLLQLRHRHFDLLIDVHGTSRSRQQKLIINPKRSIGMARGDANDRLYTETVQRDHRGHMIKEYGLLLEHFGIEAQESDFKLELAISQNDEEQADKLLREHGVGGPFVVIQPTTSGRPDHVVWPDDRFGKVIEALAERGFQSVASSDEKGRETIQRIQNVTGAPIVNLAGKTDPLVLAAILKRSALYFGYNTGPMHIASAVNIPMVAIFQEPKKHRPWHPLSEACWQVLLSIFRLRQHFRNVRRKDNFSR